MKDVQVRIPYRVYKLVMQWAKKDGRTIKSQLDRMLMSSHAVLKDMEIVKGPSATERAGKILTEER